MHVFTNGRFISCEDENRVFSVLATHMGRIAYTGNTVPPPYAKAPRTSLGDRAVVPAFADTHLHFESYALFLSTVDVRDAESLDAMGEMLREYAKRHPRQRFLPAYGCSAHTLAERRLPTRADLDAMLGIPLLIVKYDGHAAVANSALIAEFGPEVTGDPGFDAENGWLYQNAFYKGVNHITARVPPLRVLAGMQAAAARLARAGVGYLHTAEGVGYKNDLDVDTLLMARSGLPQALKVFFQTTDVEKVQKRGLGQIGGCFRLALDGCFGSEDAAVSGGYANNPQNKGFLLYTQAQVDDFCIRANRAGLQIALHAIGDVAVEQALNAYAAALADAPREDHRHIIIHADLIPPPLVARAAELGVAIALQPNFLRWPQEPPAYLEALLGPRAAQLLPLRDLIDAGLLISAGSDAPCTVPNVIESIYNCCNHPNPAQSVTVQQALWMHTLWAAKMGFDEDVRGSLTNGKAADFVVLSEDPLQMAPKDLMRLQVLETYLGGKQINTAKTPGLGRLALGIAKSYITGRGRR